ncbi:hypothetical protein ES702_04098 [subsurface metagenome]
MKTHLTTYLLIEILLGIALMLFIGGTGSNVARYEFHTARQYERHIQVGSFITREYVFIFDNQTGIAKKYTVEYQNFSFKEK